MDLLGKRLNQKIQKLFNLTGLSQRAFAAQIDVPTATTNDYISKNKNVSGLTLVKILLGLGIDVEALVDERIREVVNVVKPRRVQESEDIAILLDGLEKNHRRELVRIAINFNKLKKNKNIADVIDRVEKRYVQ